MYPIDRKNITKILYKKSPAHSAKYKKGIYRYAVDFVCAEGTPVKAAADGKIIEVVCDNNVGGPEENFDRFANYIEIEHGNGEYSECEHLKMNSAVVKVGDSVISGQKIAESGATGWLADLGPHLHFMVGMYGKTIEDYQTINIVWKKKTKS